MTVQLRDVHSGDVMQEDGEVLQFTVVATDTKRNRIWLTVAVSETDEYDGYNTDAIFIATDEISKAWGRVWEFQLGDERNSFPASVYIEQV